MRKLIINADDFALTDGCNKGIIECFKKGIVTSTTIIVTVDNWQQAALLAKKQGIGLGLHLCLTHGKPITQLDNMLDENGYFKKLDTFQQPINKQAIKAEWIAQANRLLEMAIYPDHLDSHHHIHTLNHELLDIAMQLAKQLDIPLRQTNDAIKGLCKQKNIKTTDVFMRNFYGQTANKQELVRILQFPWQGTMEIMCHPAFVDEELLKISSYNTPRQKELEVLTDNDIKTCIEKEQIQLISFANI